MILPSFERADCICCQEIDEVAAEADRNNVRCITSAQDFDAAILNPVTTYISHGNISRKNGDSKPSLLVQETMSELNISYCTTPNKNIAI